MLKLYNTIPQKQYLETLLKDREYISRKWPDLKSKVPSICLIVDIFQNARRKALESNFDDAVARLYRCIEMMVNMYFCNMT
jgi:CRISPR-associated protein (Cas_Cas02710)